MSLKIDINTKVFLGAYRPYINNYEKRYEVYYGGAGSGKSYFVGQKIIVKALKSKRRILVVRKIERTIKDSVFRLLTEIIQNWGLMRYTNINKSTKTITFVNGSEIICRGLDDPEKIKSVFDVTDIWAEEATELLPDDVSQLDLRLRTKAKNLQFYFTFNPISKVNWTYSKWFSPDAETDEDTRIVKTTYKDNERLDESYINSLKKLIKENYNYYKVYALGEYCSLDKLVFTNWEAKKLDVNEFRNKQGLERAVGLDFGFTNDPTVLTESYIDEKNKIWYVLNEWYATGQTNDKIADMIKYLGLSKSVIVADSAEQKSIVEIKNKGIYRIKPAEKGQGSVNEGLDEMQQYKFVINDKCTNTITEFENYSWQKDKKTNEYINKPIDDFNHCIDALRYSAQCRKNTAKVLPKSILGL